MGMMFQTFESDRIYLGEKFSADGANAWTQVRMGDFSPHFMVVVGPTPEYLPETWQIAAAEDLVLCHAAIKRDFPGRSVQTYLLSPAHMNKTSQWQIEALAEVWECNHLPDSDKAFRYVLSNGRTYFQGVREWEVDSMQENPNWVRLY